MGEGNLPTIGDRLDQCVVPAFMGHHRGRDGGTSLFGMEFLPAGGQSDLQGEGEIKPGVIHTVRQLQGDFVGGNLFDLHLGRIPFLSVLADFAKQAAPEIIAVHPSSQEFEFVLQVFADFGLDAVEVRTVPTPVEGARGIEQVVQSLAGKAWLQVDVAEAVDLHVIRLAQGIETAAGSAGPNEVFCGSRGVIQIRVFPTWVGEREAAGSGDVLLDGLLRVRIFRFDAFPQGAIGVEVRHRMGLDIVAGVGELLEGGPGSPVGGFVIRDRARDYEPSDL